MVSEAEISVGDRFERLVVIELGHHNSDGRKAAKCRCLCGKERIVILKHLRSGNTKSCGCLQRDKAGKRWRTHGMTGSRLHVVWKGMRGRCERPTFKAYRNYGGRGIKVCREWHTFRNFYDWAMANGYRQGLTIERIDNDGNYEPDNCRWATRKEQIKNRRNTKFLTAFGETKPMTEWVDDPRCVVDYHVLKLRLRYKYPAEIAMTTPLRENMRLAPVTIDGVTKTIAEWSKDERCSVGMWTVMYRIKKGMEASQALFSPNHCIGVATRKQMKLPNPIIPMVQSKPSSGLLRLIPA
jgi:hypothetical protein